MNIDNEITEGNDQSKIPKKFTPPPFPIAYCINGKDFVYETSLDNPFPIGSYVLIYTKDNRKYLGQILSQEVLNKYEIPLILKGKNDTYVNAGRLFFSESSLGLGKYRYIQGAGRILIGYKNDKLIRTCDKDIFDNASIVLSTNKAIAQYYSSITREYKPIEIGRFLHSSGQARVFLNPANLNCHTFLFGQSRSGKSYALSVILEQLLLNTDLKMIIIDPNSDYVKIDQLCSFDEINRNSSIITKKKYEDITKRYYEIVPSIKIFRPRNPNFISSHELKIRFSDLDPHEQEAVLKLDPLNNIEECFYFWTTINELTKNGIYSLDDINKLIERYSSSYDVRRLKQRISNLRISDWEIWCTTNGYSFIDALQGDWRCLVADIGMLSYPQNSIIATAILSYFWSNRDQRIPVLIVIDEAHIICPHSPLSYFDSMSAEYAVRIAGEGKKFGLYLLVSTQRPEKVNSNVISESDNLILMRMNSNNDLEHITKYFSYVPKQLLNQSVNFSRGDALIAGNLSYGVTFVKFEGRISHEGGSDLPATWALKRTSL